MTRQAAIALAEIDYKLSQLIASDLTRDELIDRLTYLQELAERTGKDAALELHRQDAQHTDAE